MSGLLARIRERATWLRSWLVDRVVGRSLLERFKKAEGAFDTMLDEVRARPDSLAQLRMDAMSINIDLESSGKALLMLASSFPGPNNDDQE